MDGRPCDAKPAAGQTLASLRAADWLNLTAAPTFAIMALVTAAQDGGTANMLCSAAYDGSRLSGMTLMYGLMSTFHSASWLKLLSRVALRS
jgi:hypothetical protein